MPGAIRAFLACRSASRSSPNRLRRSSVVSRRTVAAALEISRSGHPVGGVECGRPLLAEYAGNFVGLPDVELSLFAFAVGVQARVEAAVRGAHLPPEKVDGFSDRPDQRPVAATAAAPGLRVDPQQLTLVVEHLFEVGNAPMRVDRVAVKPASDVVVDAAAGHLATAEGDVGKGILCFVGRQHVGGREQQIEVGWGRKLWSRAKASVHPVRGPQ